MSTLQTEIIHRLGVKPTVEVEVEITRRVTFLQNYLLKTKSSGLLIAISGGVDSAVATALCKQATDELSKQRGETYYTLGLFQPCGMQEDIADSYEVANVFGLNHLMENNISASVKQLGKDAELLLANKAKSPRALSKEGLGNIKARTRMVMQYALAFENNLLVVGTDHASEALTGFYTKWGDGAVDLTPLSTLNKRQVKQLAVTLNVPKQIICKVPTAGLWEGQTDEQEIGVSYEVNSDYLEGKKIEERAKKILETRYKATAHKRSLIPGI